MMRLHGGLNKIQWRFYMKKLMVTLTVVAILALSAGAFAFGPGWFGGWGNRGMGPGMMGSGMMGGYGMGPGMMGPGMMGGYGMGPGMMGPGGYGYDRNGYGYDNKYLDETADLRKELNEKRFEYFEAVRNPKTDPETVQKLEKEIAGIQQKLYEKSPRTAYRGGYGNFGAPCTQ